MAHASLIAAWVHRRRRVTPVLVFTGDSPGSTFSRTGDARYHDADGVVQVAATGVLRNAHYVNGRRAVLLEPGRTNLCIRSQELNLWSASGASVPTTNATAPDGSATAAVLQAASTAGWVGITTTYTADGVKCVEVYLKAGTSIRSAIVIRDTTANVFRHQVQVTWSGGVPSPTTASGSGTIFGVESLDDGWYRILLNADGIVAANTNQVRIYPDDAAGTGTVIAWNPQSENAAYPTSPIPTTGVTASRNAETLTLDVVQDWQAMTFYARIPYESGTGFSAGTYFALKPSAASPVISINRDTSGNYRLSHNNGSATVHGAVGSASTLGAIIEIRGIVYPDGSVQAGISVNGGAESLGARSAANAFSATQPDRVEFGSVLNAPLLFSHFYVANGVRSLAELRSAAGV